MDSTHIHLLLNHFPIIGTLIGSALLLWGIIKNQHNIKTISAVVIAIMAIIAIPVLTGEPAEETVEKIVGVSENMIELHEDAAKIAIWIMEITGLLALLSLYFNRKNEIIAKNLFIATILFSLLTFATMARTGYYGGQIRHTELSNGNATKTKPNANQEIEATKENKEKKKDKDDDD